MSKKQVLQLADEIKTKNGTYKLVERTKTKAIYQHNNRAYEVFLVQKVNYHKKLNSLATFKNREVDLQDAPEFKEIYPRDEDFGKTAWYITTLEKAKLKYEEL